MDVAISAPKGPWKTRLVTAGGEPWGKIRKVAGSNRHYQVICDRFIFRSSLFSGANTNTVVCQGFHNAVSIVNESVAGTFFHLIKGEETE